MGSSARLCSHKQIHALSTLLSQCNGGKLGGRGCERTTSPTERPITENPCFAWRRPDVVPKQSGRVKLRSPRPRTARHARGRYGSTEVRMARDKASSMRWRLATISVSPPDSLHAALSVETLVLTIKARVGGPCDWHGGTYPRPEVRTFVRQVRRFQPDHRATVQHMIANA